MEIDEFIPKKIEGTNYALMLVQTSICPICGKTMIKAEKERGLFPSYIRHDQETQMKRAGFVFRGNTLVDDESICTECEKAGKANFLCQLCNERKPTNKQQESFGWPSVFLCSDCYETVSAKAWEEKCDKLREEHRYDFE
jgi:hypothetical protein